MPRTRQLLASLAVTGMTAGGLLVVASPAEAAPKYSSCDALSSDFRYGVAKNRKAAKRQYRMGSYRPASGPKARRVYANNNANLDRDKDGTACEIAR